MSANTEQMPFGITREELLQLAASKLADQFADEEHLSELVRDKIEQRVKAAFEQTLERRIDDFLRIEMEKLLSQEISPVDIWGDKTGKPTTIRAALASRARDFWEVRVDNEGRQSGCYGGSPRHEVLFKKIVNEEFEKAVKENCGEIVAAFKAALKVDAARITAEHIDKLIFTKRVPR